MSLNNKRMFIVPALMLALVALLASACAAPVTGGEATNEHTVTVRGSGQASGTPDVAYIELGVSVQAGDLDRALQDANSTMDAVRSAIEDAGVAAEDMRTSRFNVYTENPRDDRGQPTGQPIYHVDNTLRVTVRDITTTGDVIGAGLDAGANAVNNLQFGIEDTSALEAEARSEAIADARARAEQLAEGLGVTVGAPASVSESFGGGPVIERAAFDMAEEAAGAPPISQGQLTVTVSVNVSFLIEQ